MIGLAGSIGNLLFGRTFTAGFTAVDGAVRLLPRVSGVGFPSSAFRTGGAFCSLPSARLGCLFASYRQQNSNNRGNNGISAVRVYELVGIVIGIGIPIEVIASLGIGSHGINAEEPPRNRIVVPLLHIQRCARGESSYRKAVSLDVARVCGRSALYEPPVLKRIFPRGTFWPKHAREGKAISG